MYHPPTPGRYIKNSSQIILSNGRRSTTEMSLLPLWEIYAKPIGVDKHV